MEALQIFSQISPADVKAMLECFGVKRKKYAPDQVVAIPAGEETVFVLSSGAARLVYFDACGNKSILEHYGPNDMFSGLFSVSEELLVECTEASEVLCLDFRKLTTPCANACRHHSQLISNALMLLARKARSLSERINVLSQRTIRGKLLAYLDALSRSTGRRRVTLELSLSDLADYLCVDRSAMMRQLQQLKQEQMLAGKGRELTLLYGRE